MNRFLEKGIKVTFDNDKVETFIAETSDKSSEITQFQKLVLAGIDLVGIVKESGVTMTAVSYEDGWELPIPTRYLIPLL